MFHLQSLIISMASYDIYTEQKWAPHEMNLTLTLTHKLNGQHQFNTSFFLVLLLSGELVKKR